MAHNTKRRQTPVMAALFAQDRGAATVEYAVIIGVALLIAAVVLGPHLLQLVQSLVSKWQIP